jgi:assimilatory nitrate reductase catalytic subunit
MNALPPHARAVRTTCPYCGVGCGIIASVDRHGAATISGDPAHPANFGRLCSKGSALGKVADGLRTILDRDGPNAIAFYLSGQLLTEDYYVANKLMKGFLGSANVDTNSRLCMASSVAGHRRAFGADTVPAIYRDFDEADLILLVGSNAAWCHPILHQRMIAAKNERGARLVVIDPRRTATAEAADLFLPIAPGTDTALFCGLLAHLAETRALDRGYIAQHTAGFEVKTRSRDAATSPATRPRPRKRPGLTPPTSSASSNSSGKPSASSLATRKESINRRKAPTRSTPSSTFIPQPAGSDGRAWARSR